MKELRSMGRLREDVARRIRRRIFSTDPERELHRVEQLGARILTFRDAAYPVALRQIRTPPMVLYVKGRHLPVHQDQVAVVGSRSPTPYGVKTAGNLATGLGCSGIGVVSGMARGIDAAAHWGALDTDGGTVAVLGTGIDRVYPRSNRKLFERIVERGAVVTEFPLGTPPEGRNFPIRNRIISGLSQGVVVVEAAQRSGSLITASLALDQGRDVLAVPGSVRSFKSRGCHFLLKQGAALAESAEDIVETLGLRPCITASASDSEGARPSRVALDPEEARVTALLGDDPVHIDHIVREARIAPSRVLGILTKMELKGLVEQLPGKFFVRA
jgi:DNA processing protein